MQGYQGSNLPNSLLANSVNSYWVTRKVVIGFLLLLLMLLYTPSSITAMEQGKSPVIFYDTYQSGFHNQNWRIKQHTNGLMYAANGNNLLVFDGTNWQGLLVESDIDMSDFIFLHNRIYVGTANGRGYLETDSSGQWHYHSLTKLQSSVDSNLTIRVLSIDDHIVFLTNEHLWILRPDGLFESAAQGHFVDMWKVDKQIIVQSKGQELNYFDPIADKWTNIIDANQFLKATSLKAFVSSPAHNSFLLISSSAIYSHRKHAQTQLDTVAINWLRQHEVQVGTFLHNGEVALAGRSGGILIVNTRGETQRIINKTTGFNRLLITDLTVDHHGNLWTTHSDNGISRIEVGAGSMDFDNDLGINNANYLARFNNKIFAASFFGLRALESSTGGIEAFKPIGNQGAKVLAFTVVGDELLFADNTGLQTLRYEKNEMQLSRIHHKQDIGFVTRLGRPVGEGTRVYANTKLGVIRLEKNNQAKNNEIEPSYPWQVSKLNGFQAYTEFIEQDRWGNLWVGSRDGNLYRISELEQWPDAQVERVDKLSVNNAGNVHIFEFHGDVIISTSQGVFRVEDGNAQPDKRFTELHTQYGYIHRLQKASSKGEYWVCFTPKHLGKLTLAGGKLHFSALERVNNRPVKALFDDAGNGQLWVGHNVGVSRISLGNEIREKKFTPRTGVIINKDTQMKLNHHSMDSQQTQAIVLPPGRHNLRFNAEIPHYSLSDKVKVRSRLEGFQQRWSNWSADVYIDYMGLGYGQYTWTVEVKYNDGTVLRSMPVDLTVSPHWYNKMWVLIAGALCVLLLIIAVIYAAFYWRIIILKRRAHTLETIVGERTKAISAKNAEITALHERKTRFFYYISHEFRTPLALVMGTHQAVLNALEKPGESPASSAINRMIKLAHNNSQRLNQLVNRLLDQHLAEQGQLKLSVEQYSLRGFLEELLASFSLECQQRQVNMNLNIEEDFELWFDREHMISIFYNIISNALKYSYENGEVCLSVCRNGPRVKIIVADNGIGIPKEVLNKVFAPYYRHPSAQQESRGHGLGLAFSKTLVELHGGEISLASNSVEGTQVSVCLPFGKEHFDPDCLKKSIDTSPSGVMMISSDYLSDDERTSASAQAATLLVVEDNYELCQFIRLVLQTEFNIVIEHNGYKALDYCKKSPPDLIIADVMMPVLNGIEMTRALKANPATKAIPIILLTALADKPSVVKGLDAGADDYLSKPFHIGELKLRITRLLCVADDYTTKKAQLPPLPADNDFKSAIRVEIGLNYTDPNYSIDIMASNLGWDRHNLYRYVKDYFGQSPTELLLNTRLDRAKHLIETSNQSISSIAYECGFNSVSYFNRSFKKRCHVTPTAWRKRQSTQALTE